MLYIVANRGLASRALLRGREHVVVGMTMMVPGILNGSQGPLLYEEPDIQAAVRAWNGLPIVNRHPKEGSARTPEYLNAAQLGVVLDARYSKSSLVANGWFDIEDCNRIDMRIVPALLNGSKLELSTGLGVVIEQKSGVLQDGSVYNGVARQHAPDHLALLLDEIGACSVQMGCGVNNQQLSHEDLRQALRQMLRARYGRPANGVDGPVEAELWVADVFDKFVVFEHGGKLWKLGYMTDLRTNAVSLEEGDAVEVRRVSEYKPVSNTGVIKMAQKTTVDSLLALNCACEAHRPALEAMPEEAALALLSSAQKSKAEEDRLKAEVVNAARQQQQPTTLSAEDWWKQAPADVKAVVENAKRAEAEEREKLMTAILGNTRNTFSKETLGALSLSDLRSVANLAQPQQTQGSSGGGHDYSGSTGFGLKPVENVAHLAQPEWDWKGMAKGAAS